MSTIQIGPDGQLTPIPTPFPTPIPSPIPSQTNDCDGNWMDIPVCDSSGFQLQIYGIKNKVFSGKLCSNNTGDLQIGKKLCDKDSNFFIPNFMNGAKDPLLTLYPAGGFPNCVRPTQPIENIFTSSTYFCNMDSKKTQAELGISNPGIISNGIAVNQSSSFGCENIVLINKFIQDAISNISCIIKNSIPANNLKKLPNTKLSLSNTSLKFSNDFDSTQSSDMYFIDSLSMVGKLGSEEAFNQLPAVAAMINKVINQAIKFADIQPLKITNNNKACSDTVNFLQTFIKGMGSFKCKPIPDNGFNMISFSDVNITLNGNFKLSPNSIFDIAATAIVSEAMTAVINTSESIISDLSAKSNISDLSSKKIISDLSSKKIISDLSSKTNCVGKWVDTSTCDEHGFLKQSYQIITQPASGGSTCSHTTGDTQLGTTSCTQSSTSTSSSIFSNPVIIFIIIALILIIALVIVKYFMRKKVSLLNFRRPCSKSINKYK